MNQRLLKATANIKSAREMLSQKPFLLLVKLYSIRDFDQWLFYEGAEELAKSHRYILSSAIGKNATKMELNILNKILISGRHDLILSTEELRYIYQFIKNYEDFKDIRFSHMAYIPTDLIVRIVRDGYQLSNHYVSLANNGNSYFGTRFDWEYALELQERILELGVFNNKTLNRIRMAKSVQSLIKAFGLELDKYKNVQARKLPRITYSPPFPAIPGKIEPVLNSDELFEMSKSMRNCLFDYYGKINEKLYLYKVIGKKNYVFSIIRNHRTGERYILDQLRGYRNQEPTMDVVRLVNKWIEDSQEEESSSHSLNFSDLKILL